MPRPPRLVLPGVPMHVVQRGNNRTRTFHDVIAFQRFATFLVDASATHGCAIHAYVFMSNHFHLLLTPRDADGPACMMQQLGRTFGPWLNARRQRTGALWEGRFRSSLIDSTRYFYACSRYIELNPVRAGITATADAYPWSSYRSNALGIPDPLVTRHPLYDALGIDVLERASAYRALFGEPIPIDALDRLRRAVRTGSRRRDEADDPAGRAA